MIIGNTSITHSSVGVILTAITIILLIVLATKTATTMAITLAIVLVIHTTIAKTLTIVCTPLGMRTINIEK